MVQYVFKQWDSTRDVPSDISAFMDVLSEIEKVHLEDELHPVVVKCL